METLVPVARPWAYWIYIGISRRIKKVQKVVPVILGEWRICNKCADCQGRQGDRARQGEDNRAIGGLEMDAWSEAAGWSCWNCQLLRIGTSPPTGPGRRAGTLQLLLERLADKGYDALRKAENK